MTSTLSSNTVLGDRYRLTERIAAGGQGEVWRAQDTALGRPAALKVLRGEYADDAEFRERFRREAQHAAMLSHPGIAQVFDYNEGDHGTAPYLVMEYVDGEPLSAAIAREAPMNHDRVLDIIIAAASALAAAHAAGLVHRDVKPGNLLLGRDGSIKITDFGIARVMHASPLTRTGTLMGTPLYLSPEQATGGRATAASDLYALGVLAYEMLVGNPPYEGPPTAVLLAHRDTPLPPLPPPVPSGLADLVHALTAKDPAMRPHTATAVADRAIRLRTDPATKAPDTQRPDDTPLDQPIPGLERKARPEGLTQILAQPFESARRRRAVPLVLGGLAIASIVGIAGWYALPAAQHRPSADQNPPAVQSPTPPPASPSKTRTTPPIKHPKPATRVTNHRASHSKHDKHNKHKR
jgi:serine/threonine-protein kinase